MIEQNDESLQIAKKTTV